MDSLVFDVFIAADNENDDSVKVDLINALVSWFRFRIIVLQSRTARTGCLLLPLSPLLHSFIMSNEVRPTFPVYIDPVRKIPIPHYFHPKDYNNNRLLYPKNEVNTSSHLARGKKAKWNDTDTGIFLDYLEVNCDQWLFYKVGFYNFLHQTSLKNKTPSQMQRQIFTLLRKYRRCKAGGKEGFEWYERMHKIFKDRKEPQFQEITSDTEDDQPKRKEKRRREEESDVDSSQSDEESTQKNKKISSTMRWSCEEMCVLLDFIIENIDAFVENYNLFWSWMSHNVLLGRTPAQIRRRYFILSPTCKYGMNLEKTKVSDDLVAKRDRCFDLLREKNIRKDKKKGKNKCLKPVTFKFPKEHEGYMPSDKKIQELIEMDATNTKAVKPRYVDVRQNISDILHANHLLKYSLGEDAQLLRKCLGNSGKTRWPERLRDIEIEWAGDLNEEELDVIDSNGSNVTSALYSEDEDCESQRTIEGDHQPSLITNSKEKSEAMMNHEIGLIVNVVNERGLEDGSNENIIGEEQKHRIADSIKSSLRQTLDAVGLLRPPNAEMGTGDFSNSDAGVIKWDTILRAASLARLPPG
ncbi:2271_t:CDS:2 [Acaulospora colombiana]|uniref:2271_t:CDS:1 n=1 Tax=Acaulospora colombiana TaxID=27376 RepID=A0ACA9M7F5_9GLOM|nr:2271_t:CDS:2 [Acaulospora colombiana]